MHALRLLRDAQTGHTAYAALWRDLKAHLMAGHRLEIEVRPERRNTAQNALLHALLQEIAERKPWAGELRDVESWKRLLCAAWLRAEGESIQLLPAVDGKGLDVVYTPTSTLSKAQMTSLIEYVSAFAAEHGVIEATSAVTQ